MNVVILTPDSVGSTLLQRTITVQMLLSDFDKPVINLHELTNGLTSHYSPDLQSMVLGKDFKLGYSQSLNTIVQLLEAHDHYKTSRLAHYHLIRRQDSLEDQKNLYRHLNRNFFIIMAKRTNLLDYALSWALRNISKKINVYSSSEKVYSLVEMYKDPVTIDIERLTNHLDDYKKYVDWANINFDINSTFYYEQHLPNLENYILNLPIFSNKQKRSWHDAFNISFTDFNKCHKSVSDIGALALTKPDDIKLLTHDKNDSTIDLEETIIKNLPASTQTYLSVHKQNYKKTHKAIDHLVKLGLLVTNIPVKKHTFAEKKLVVKNFSDCINAYNVWVQKNPNLGEPIESNTLQLCHESDNTIWSTTA